ncbi:hypothetical protein BIWAKO_01951 [Bosea sp. BIWAKO-01]|nr:hypothetical protein BIWAKO_01951 [Bosea sp. BIWAKO-01]
MKTLGAWRNRSLLQHNIFDDSVVGAHSAAIIPGFQAGS